MIDMEHKQYDIPNDIARPKNTDYVSSPNVFRLDKNLIVKDFFYSTDIETAMLRGQRINRLAISGNYSMALIDYLIGVTSLAIAPTIGLPKPKLAGIGKIYVVKDETGSAATTTITVVSQGEENIDGAANTTLTTNYQSKSFYTNGANWFIY